MPTIGEVAHINGDDDSLDGRARRLWETLVGKCHGLGIQPRKSGGHTGYLYNGSLNQVVAEIWPNLLMTEGRETPVAKSFVSTLKSHLKTNKNVNFDVVRGQLFVSAEYHEPKVKARLNPVSYIIAQPDEMSVLERSKEIWKRARDYCAKRGGQFQVIEEVTFWECDKPLNYFVKAAFPDLHDFERQKRPLYDFLRSTTNAINVGSKTDESMRDGEHHWLIRDDWCEAGTKVIFRSPRKPDSIDKRAERLTPHEAGEDRSPAPVTVTQQAQEATPVPNDNAKPAPKPEPPKDKPVTCPECKTEWKNDNALAAHSKVHKTPAALKMVVDAVEQGQKDARKVVELQQRVDTLSEELAMMRGELDLAKTEGDASTLMELLTDVLAKCSSGAISPMRAVADVDDLLRTMKGQR